MCGPGSKHERIRARGNRCPVRTGTYDDDADRGVVRPDQARPPV